MITSLVACCFIGVIYSLYMFADIFRKIHPPTNDLRIDRGY